MGRLIDDDPLVLDDKVLAANDAALAIERAGDTVGHDVLDLGMALAMLQVACGGGVHHGASNGMREMLLQAGREAQHLRLVPAVEGKHAGDLGFGVGEGARLVEDDGIGIGHGLEVLGTLDHEALAHALVHGRKHGDGTRELEGTRVVHHHGGSRLHQALCGDGDNTGKQEVPRDDLVGKRLAARLHARLEGLRLLDEAHDGAQARLTRAGVHPHEDLARLHGGAGEHVVAHRALHGEGLAGKRRLVDHRAARLDRAVDADGHARANDDEVALGKRRGGNADLALAVDELGRLGRVEKRADELALRTGAGVFLERLAKVEQEHRGRGGFGIPADEGHADGRSVEHGHVEPAVRKRVERGGKEVAIAPNGPGGAQGGRQEPPAGIVGAHQPQDVLHEGARLCRRVVGRKLSGRLDIGGLDAHEVAKDALLCPLAGSVADRNLAVARVDRRLRDVRTSPNHLLEGGNVTLGNRAAQLDAHASRKFFDRCEVHESSFVR